MYRNRLIKGSWAQKCYIKIQITTLPKSVHTLLLITGNRTFVFVDYQIQFHDNIPDNDLPAEHGHPFTWTFSGVATWAPSQHKDRLSRYGISMLKIRRLRDCLIFNMGVPILVRWHLYIETPTNTPPPGPDSIYRCHLTSKGKSHCGDKTVAISSYLNNGISYTGKMASLYWTYLLYAKTHLQARYITRWRHMVVMASRIANHSTICWTVCSGIHKRTCQSTALLALCWGNPPVTVELNSQNASDAVNVSILWRHDEVSKDNKNFWCRVWNIPGKYANDCFTDALAPFVARSWLTMALHV